MTPTQVSCGDRVRRTMALLAALAALACALATPAAQAIPLFNRQTGQNCVACHAGGQFPELTPYGRVFKMTGYTIGQRTLPLSVMGVVTYTKVADTAKSDDPGADFQKNGVPIFATGSVFLGGKVTDNVGAFAQITYDRYASRNDNLDWHSHTNADNIDVRFADRFIDAQRDLIVGASLNNNPSVSDPWNTAAAWMQYVPVPSPTSSQFIDGNAPYPGFAAGGNTAGLTGYAFWNKLLYAEFGLYRTANGALRVMSAGVPAAERTALKGLNPYWRLALNHEWGAHSAMIGTSGMTARLYDDPLNTRDSSTLHRFRDVGVDAMYQYLLDPHSITAQLARGRRLHRYPDALVGQPVAFVDAAGGALDATSFSDSTTVTRLKLTYVYKAKYGGSAGAFDLRGTYNTAYLSAGYDPATLTITSDPTAAAPSTRVSGNLSGKPDTRGWTLEGFYTPVQYLRLGVQYTAYNRINGLATNYDGFGRNARDNNTVFLYAWGAY